MSARSAALVCASFLLACGASEPAVAPEPEVPERCQSVHLDRLADNDWILVKGSSGADAKVRMRIMPDAGNEGSYQAWYIGGMFTKVRLKGTKREKDVQFTEQPTGRRAALFDKGELELVRMYVVPKVKQCAIEVLVGTVDKKDKEKIPPKGLEMVAFPEKEGVAFTYRPPDRPLFLGKAARDRTIAEQQLKESGEPNPEHEYGDIPVGLFSKASEDGDASCTFDMDLYFDDRNQADLVAVPAGEAKGDWRHWFHIWKAPYSGNHHFEMYRYRTCGGERELIDVAAIEAILL